jgi:hypothetical protein
VVVIPRVYLDNVITSGWILKDLKPHEEMEAVERLYALHDAGIIKRVTSKISGIEQARTTDLQKRAVLAASVDLVSVVQNDHRLLGFANLDYGARGFISYPSRSKALIDARAWIAPRMDLPEGTVSHQVRSGGEPERSQVSADVWFTDWERGGTLLEEARHLPKWHQTLSLIWFESEEIPTAAAVRQERRWEYEGRDTSHKRDEEDVDGLKELDGNLRWDRKNRYR